MATAASSQRLLFSAATTASKTTSLQSLSRLFVRQCGTWAPRTAANSASSRYSQSSMPIRNSGFIAPASFVRSQTRAFSNTPLAQHNHLTAPKPGEELSVTFIDKDEQSHTFKVAKGDNLLDIALDNDIEMEGACGGSCACSTCHVIVESDHYDAMEEPDDDENDMLDLAFGLTETSRLGCQIRMSEKLDGLVVRLPAMTRNLQASDFKST